MPILENDYIAICCESTGRNLSVLDKKRGTSWLLDEKTLVYGSRHTAGVSDRVKNFKLFEPCSAEINGENTLTVQYNTEENISIKMNYSICSDHISVKIPVHGEGEAVDHLAMPGSFSPHGDKVRLILPIMQGILWDGRGSVMDELRGEAGHQGFVMPLIGYLSRTGGLLFTAETQDDVSWWLGKEENGRIWAANIQESSLGSIRYERMGRLYLTGPDIVDIAKAYRKKVMQQGRFKSWEEKIALRPGLERLFGALMCFIGYCQDDIDYVECCRKLKVYGFDRALVYPGRFNMFYKDIKMGGLPAIDLSREEIKAIKSLGYDVAPWSWLNEALDDGAEKTRHMYRKNNEGGNISNWKIEDQQWYLTCTAFLENAQKKAMINDISEMTWDHFDVLTCATNGECYAMDHPGHFDRPLSRTEDRQWIRKVLLAGHSDGRAISSENFNDAYSLEYDIGSVKAWPQFGEWPFWPIPLTMLVYHDSMIHSWWELHSYNNPWRCMSLWSRYFQYGGGRPRLMAAADALMGCPPDVFPFGAQYGFTGKDNDSYYFKYRFEDPEVQIALKEALPVSRLHKRIGKLELVHFQILSEDGHIQESAFSDGTRVVANFSSDVYNMSNVKVDGVKSLMPESWQVAD